MLFKVVLNRQTRMVDCPEAPTLEALQAVIRKTFPQLGQFTITYLDDDEDQIIIDQQVDLDTFLASTHKKPKIYVTAAPSEQPQVAKAPHRPSIPEDEAIKVSEEEGSKVEESLEEVPSVSQEESKEESQFQIQEEEKKQEKPARAESQLAEERPVEGQKKQGPVHDLQCDSCEVRPIVGDRFKSAVRPDYNVCADCQPKQSDSHPLMKIYEPEQEPVAVSVSFKQALEMSRMIKESVPAEEIKAECEGERRQMIISYLGDILGHEHFQLYKKFASQTKIQHYEHLIEGYLSWSEQQASSSQPRTVLGYLNSLKKNFLGLFGAS